MKQIILLFLLIFSSIHAKAQCEETDEARILLLGDSWAFFMNLDETFNNVCDTYGHSNKVYHTVPDLSVNGARTEDFLTTARKDLMQAELEANPSITAIHISLGGNDFLGDWKVSYTPAETDALILETKNEIIELIDFLRSIRPNIQIVFSGYMYANFEEVISEAPVPEDHPFYGNWENMEFPTFLQLNTVLNTFAFEIEGLVAADPNLDYYHVPALMQYYYGQDTPLSVAPGGSYAPFTQPLPDGDINYPSPQESMRDYLGLFLDCFHLNPEAYEVMIGYQFQKFYQKFLMDDLYLLSDVAGETGTVTSGGDVMDTLAIGDVGGVVHAAVLSFNTTLAADTVLASASIFLHRDSILGGNPIGTTLNVKMKSGFFGIDANVGAEDIMAPVDIIDDACVFGTSANDGDWIRIDLPEDFLSLISNADITQFVITSAGADDELVYYSNHSDPEFAPILNLRYKYQFASSPESELAPISIYPNPANDLIFVEHSGAENQEIQIIDINGNVVVSTIYSVAGISIADLAAGTYVIQTKVNDELRYSKFIKQ